MEAGFILYLQYNINCSNDYGFYISSFNMG